MGLRSGSYPDHARIVTGTRYVENEEDAPDGQENERISEINELDAEMLLATTRNMADLYWTRPGTTISDPRVERSWGGGACPEQHWGYLKDGRCFYLRMRHGWASLQLGPAGLDPNVDLPLVNPLWNNEDFSAALAAGEEYPYPFFAEPRPDLSVYPDDPEGDWAGWFMEPGDRERAFSTLLDQILAEES